MRSPYLWESGIGLGGGIHSLQPVNVCIEVKLKRNELYLATVFHLRFIRNVELEDDFESLFGEDVE
jgi:hypothetical protein